MTETYKSDWPLWRKVIFRFLFIYFLLSAAAGLLPFLSFMAPFLSFISSGFVAINSPIVTFFNDYIWQLKDQLVPTGGSGDTSFGWAELYTYLFLGLVGSLIWSILDRKRTQYETLDYWLRTYLRYFIAAVALIYGVIKLYALQMPFPNLHQLATPLGDFLPMRLSWMFMGYSAKYQIFSGLMETIVGLLLLNRRTITAGVLLGIGVFTNVVLLNLSYDIPVKIFSIQILTSCIFLALCDWRRIINFFLLNRPVPPDYSYDITLSKKWQQIGRVVLKAAFIVLFVIMPFYRCGNMYKDFHAREEVKPIKAGVYEVKTFIRNNDTIPILASDTLQWKDFIFDKAGSGSVNSRDTMFRQLYGRGYFHYECDTTKQVIAIKRSSFDTTKLMSFNYQLVQPDKFKIWTVLRQDSIFMELEKSKRHFQLAERQFHWLSESNR